MEMKWISCKEKLPPKVGTFLLYDSYGGCWVSYDNEDAEWPWRVTGRDRGCVGHYSDSWFKTGDKFWLKGPSPKEADLSCCVCKDSVSISCVEVKKGWCVCVHCYDDLDEEE